MNDMNKVQALFTKAAKRLQQGDALGAKQGLLKVVKQIPDSAVAWYNLALSHQYLGENQKAIGAYTKVVKIKPDFLDGWVNLGLSYKEVGNFEEAEQAAERAASMDRHHPRTLNLLGTLAAERGDLEKAQQLFEQCLELTPDFDDVRFNLTNLLAESEQDARALEVGAPLFGGQPGNKEYRQLHAKILLALRRFDEASALVLGLQKDYPQDEAAMRLGLSYRETIRDHFGAITIAEELLERFPEDAGIWNSLGVAHFQLDSIQKAKTYFEKAMELEPSHPEYQNNVGLAFSSLGDKENAEYHYRRALEISPKHAEAFRNITIMKRFSSVDDPDAVNIERLWSQPDLDDFSAIKLSFALGKIYDDCGIYDKAFEVYKHGNDLKFTESRIDLKKYFAHMDRFIEVFNRSPTVVSAAQNRLKPIFILGMPRSGTTLVEQIVSRHPEVFGCGELPCIERAIARMEKKADPKRAYPDDFWDIPQEIFTQEAEEYETWVERLHDIHTPCITDKMPFNFVHVWLIRALFPDAPVVNCQRHPLDVITSNYFQLYGSDISFVYELEALATYYVRYYRLMEHWSRVFGDGVIHIRYEDLIQDTDNQTRQLIDAVGLHWDDACLDPKRSETAVRTASIWQVRQGIYTRSKERWRNYEQNLAPAIAVLQHENVLNEDLSYAVR